MTKTKKQTPLTSSKKKHRVIIDDEDDDDSKQARPVHAVAVATVIGEMGVVDRGAAMSLKCGY